MTRRCGQRAAKACRSVEPSGRSTSARNTGPSSTVSRGSGDWEGGKAGGGATGGRRGGLEGVSVSIKAGVVRVALGVEAGGGCVPR